MSAEPWLILRLRRPAFSIRLDRRVPWVVVGTLLLTLLVLGGYMASGEYPIAPGDVVRGVFRLQGANPDHDFILNQLRLPRALTAWTVGVMLALAGGIMQTLTRNPLASPDITGVTTGASLGAVLVLVVFPNASVVSLPTAALVGGLGVALTLYLLSWRSHDSPIQLILVGIGLTATLGAAQLIVLVYTDIQRIQQVLYWLTGSVYGRSWVHLRALLPWCLVFIPFTLLSSRHLNALHLGQDLARSVGTRIVFQRGLLILASAALAGAAVSQVGAIGFVGLLAPHIARRLVGPMHEGSQIVSGLLGGLLVLVSDLVGRLIFAPTEIPAGIIIAIVGAPFFLYLLWRGQGV